MNKTIIVLLILGLVFLPYTISGDEDTVDYVVNQELEDSETVNVVVVLEDDANFKLSEDELVISDYDFLTRDTNIDTNDIELTQTYSAVMNGFAAEVTQEGLDELEKEDNVERIYYDHAYTLALQDAVPQINASVVHGVQIGGINLTGAGQTVCVVDSGINYNHTDLGGCFGAGCKVVSGWDTYDNDSDPLDENGHGTHVAGIVASESGVAPGADLIAMKVFSASRTTTASKVIAGIDWCVANANAYNISVITMSLSLTNSSGDEVVFSSHAACDSYSDGGVVNAANNASEQGLVVTVSAGNDGNTSGIGSPACGSNVTSVGAVNKSDSLSGFGYGSVGYNRGSILDFVAPGVSINSTYYSGSTYASLSGTSMAAPHVAGAVAVLLQYVQDFENRTLTPVEIEQTLNDTSVQVYDGVTGLNFSRIDLYAALLSLDTVGPNISSQTQNGSVVLVNSTLNFSVSDLHDISSVWYNNGTDNLTDAYNASASEWFIDANWTAGEYNLTVYANDSVNNTENVLITVFVDNPPTIDNWLWNNSTSYSYNVTNISINENDTLTIELNVTDDDVYNNLTYNWTLDDVEINTTQNLTYSIGLQAAGVHNLTVNVSDEYFYVSQNWTLNVSDPFPPNWLNISNFTTNEVAWSYNLSSYVNNMDGDTLTYGVLTAGFSISSTGNISRRFWCNDSGTYDVTVNVSDGIYSDSSSFYVIVDNSCSMSDNGASCTNRNECSGGYCVGTSGTKYCSSTSYYCDSDGECESAYGETSSNCLTDCSSSSSDDSAAASTTPQAETVDLEEWDRNNSVTNDEEEQEEEQQTDTESTSSDDDNSSDNETNETNETTEVEESTYGFNGLFEVFDFSKISGSYVFELVGENSKYVVIIIVVIVSAIFFRQFRPHPHKAITLRKYKKSKKSKKK